MNKKASKQHNNNNEESRFHINPWMINLMVSLSEILYFDYKLDNIISPYMQLSKKTGNLQVPSLFILITLIVFS